MAVIGDWFTTALSLTFGEHRYVARVERGKIVQINAAPRIDARSAFGFRADGGLAQVRQPRAARPLPRLLRHAMRVPEFVLEGDGLVGMQNARALQRMMNLMRGRGERMTIMKGMGHLRMAENYPAFRPFLLPELNFMAKA